MRYDIGCSGVDWFQMVILRGKMSGAVGVSTLGDRAIVCTGGSGGAVAGGIWAITLVASGGEHPWSRLVVMLRRGR